MHIVKGLIYIREIFWCVANAPNRIVRISGSNYQSKRVPSNNAKFHDCYISQCHSKGVFNCERVT